MQASVQKENHTIVARLEGDWALSERLPRFPDLVSDVDGPESASDLRFDTSELGEWDSSLLVFVSQAQEYCVEHEISFEEEGLPEDLARLLTLARAVPEKDVASRSEQEGPLLEKLGEWSLGLWDGTVAATSFVGELIAGGLGLFRGKARFRWQDFWLTIQSNGSGALPIVTLISFLVGMIVAFLGAVVLRQFGAGYYVSYLVGYGMLREMAAVMTAIIITGRTGAAFAAELGTMKIMEEIDAFRTLGLSPIEYLVLPRILGLFVMMPFLTVYSMFIGIGGGLLVAVSMLDLNTAQFFSGMMTAITLSDAFLGVAKGTVFGLLIGISGCLRGMQTGTDAGAVGKAATSAVVTGITLIIFANAIIDWLAALLEI
jgi:phospholipid/cholesterol/gamma-HCH transport system permease protein